MRIFDVGDLSLHLAAFLEEREWAARLKAAHGDDGDPINKAAWKDSRRKLLEAQDFFGKVQFPTAFAVLDALNARAHDERPPTLSALETDMQHVTDAIFNDVFNVSFLQVPAALREYVDNEALFGSQVKIAFPSAGNDLKEAGNCLAADCNTAAVFHLMRAVEWGLRALAVHLGFRQLKIVKNSGLAKIVPLSHLEWEKVLGQLQTRVDHIVERMRPGQHKQAAQEFYYPVLQEIRAIRDAWRNHVMHTRATYSAEDAGAIFAHVHRLMTTLAVRVSEDGPSRRATSSRVRRFPTSE